MAASSVTRCLAASTKRVQAGPSSIASTSSTPFPPSLSRRLSSRPPTASEVRREKEAKQVKEAAGGTARNTALLSVLGDINPEPKSKALPRMSRPSSSTAIPGGGALSGGVANQQPRPTIRPNTLYSPGDLSKESWSAPARPLPKPPLLGPSAPLSKLSDPFHVLSINPHDEVLNAHLMQSYVSQMGKIKTRAETGLTWKNQRRMGKAVRRARAMGLISRWSDQAPTEA